MSTRLSRGRSTPAIRAMLCLLYPCRCLCRGFEQITRIWPRRRMTLQRSHIFFTDGRTFIEPRSSLVPIDDPAPRQVVRRELDQHAVPGKDPDVVHPHLPRDVRQHVVPVLELHPEHRVREWFGDRSLDLDGVFLRQAPVVPRVLDTPTHPRASRNRLRLEADRQYRGRRLEPSMTRQNAAPAAAGTLGLIGYSAVPGSTTTESCGVARSRMAPSLPDVSSSHWLIWPRSSSRASRRDRRPATDSSASRCASAIRRWDRSVTSEMIRAASASACCRTVSASCRERSTSACASCLVRSACSRASCRIRSTYVSASNLIRATSSSNDRTRSAIRAATTSYGSPTSAPADCCPSSCAPSSWIRASRSATCSATSRRCAVTSSGAYPRLTCWKSARMTEPRFMGLPRARMLLLPSSTPPCSA